MQILHPKSVSNRIGFIELPSSLPCFKERLNSPDKNEKQLYIGARGHFDFYKTMRCRKYRCRLEASLLIL